MSQGAGRLHSPVALWRRLAAAVAVLAALLAACGGTGEVLRPHPFAGARFQYLAANTLRADGQP